MPEKYFTEVVDGNNLPGESISVKEKVLTPEETIGKPEEKDVSLLNGREKIIQADFYCFFDQVFTDKYLF